MKKIISFLFLVFVLNLASYSQQDPQYTNYMYYKLGVNPGYAGAENAISGLLLNRYQWEGFKGAPKTLVFSMDAAIKPFGSEGGIGLNIVSDQIGNEENTSVNFSYAYKTTVNFGELGIGLSMGLMTKGYNGDWKGGDNKDLTSEIYTDPSSDPAIPQGEVSQMALDVGFGLYLSSNSYFLGISATHLNQAEIEFSDQATTFLARHYYLMGGYNIKLADPLFELQPTALLKTDLAGWQFDVTGRIVYDEKFWGGISYRLNDAVSLLMGLEMLNGLKVGYSFDLVTSVIGSYGFASHEFFVTYSIDLEKNRNQKYKSIRFL
ncbi:PorP/SprF family type IX secretion system membrane protein [Maribellus maritimus]|uniref:PorP/SprF family type IX secretion system membrane protein n=1 Tax=Maribellus maritimus TaxID=2870838 RepID=UPI001EEAE3AC|nr:type IX secretion system membrane protein PorP/SprF [Maribellus maritimus]MCG6189613.1 type IX secretion system membrane protein PorP/SprF [Maribellus maritimus]